MSLLRTTPRSSLSVNSSASPSSALLVGPAFLLCDEPTSALDDASREVVQAWLERVNVEKGIGVVMITHLPFTPRRIRVRRLLLETGSLIEQEEEKGSET